MVVYGWDPDLGGSMDANESTGQRIARMRKLRGVTQEGLALRASVSRSLIAKVESGQRPATPVLIAAVAKALRVEKAEITGQPYRGSDARSDAVHANIPHLRRAMACVDIAPSLEAPPRSLDELAAERDEARQLLRLASHVKLGLMLPAAIEELTAHAVETEQPRAWRLLSNVLSLAFALSRRLGYHDLAQVAVEHAAHAAQRGDDANLPHVVTLARALQLFTLGSWTTASMMMTRTAGSLDRTEPAALHVLTAAHLRGAIAAARGDRSGDAWDHHRQAVEAVSRIGPSERRDLYGLQANASNVAIHGCTVAIELGDYDQAIRHDEGLKLSPALSAARKAHHEIDMSRTFLQVNDHDMALQRLLNAEKIASQLTRFHPTARETVQVLVSRHRTLPEPLRLLENRMAF